MIAFLLKKDSVTEKLPDDKSNLIHNSLTQQNYYAFICLIQTGEQ